MSFIKFFLIECLSTGNMDFFFALDLVLFHSSCCDLEMG